MTPEEFKTKYFDKMTLEEKFKFMELVAKYIKENYLEDGLKKIKEDEKLLKKL